MTDRSHPVNPRSWVVWYIPSMARSPRYSRRHYTEDGENTLCGRFIGRFVEPKVTWPRECAQCTKKKGWGRP